MNTGSTFGEWVLQRHLGGGGNGDVWEVTSNGRAGRFAIKFLKVADQDDRLARFQDEVAFLVRNPARPGILPLIDSRLDIAGNDLWYVMPLAESLEEVLSQAKAEQVVDAVATIAGTLAGLAAEGIGHRDIKPDNLFVLDGHPVIGDFGLVTYPEKDPVTEFGVKLGPTDYMAPEMRRNADTAAHEPADVWSLAKTLWALLVRQPPLPGPHRPDDEAFAVQARLLLASAREIDQLLSRATNIAPEKRITLRLFEQELRACIRQPAEVQEPVPAEALKQRIIGMTAYRYDRDEEVRNSRRRSMSDFEQLKSALSDSYNRLTTALPTFTSVDGDNVTDALAAMNHTSIPFASWGWGIRLTFTLGDVWAVVDAAVGLRKQSDHSANEMLAVLRVFERVSGLHDQRFDWRLLMIAFTDSASLANYVVDVCSGFIDSEHKALEAVEEILRRAAATNSDPSSGGFHIGDQQSAAEAG